ncbi:MAG TPA: 30S ribosomal protein S16 [Candidatus Saccharimonadales bacterium]|nr:30S ribosomal protein S16 [Candidatus Saccharimonadales bacterium]
MVKIRLARVGTTNQPKFRIVVAEKSRATQGKFLEVIGTFDKTTKPAAFTLEKERYDYWVSQGAQPSETIYKLVNKGD